MQDLAPSSLLMGYVRRIWDLAQEIKERDGAEIYPLSSSVVLSAIVKALAPMSGNCIRKATGLIAKLSGLGLGHAGPA